MNTLLRLASHVARFFTFYRGYFATRFRRPPRVSPRTSQLPTEELLRRGFQAIQRGYFDQGITFMEQALEREPAHFVAHINLGSAYYLRATEREQTSSLRTAEEATATRTAVETDLATAAGHFEHVLALDPHHTQALLNLAAVYSELGRLDESIALLERLLQTHPQHPDVHYNLATAYLRRGDRARAKEELQKELAVNPRSSHVPSLLRKLQQEEKGRR